FGSLTGLYDVVEKKVTEVIPGIKELHPEVFDIYGRVSTTGRPETFVIEFKPLNAWLSVSAYSPATGYFVAIFDNITDRKLAEENIRESEARLKEAQSIGRFGYWLMYPESGKVLWSDELYKLYGRDPSLGPASLGESLEYFPGQQELITGSMKKAEETGETVQYDLKVVLPGGITGCHAVTVNASKGPDGSLEFYHGTVQDITDRKLAEENIRRDMEHLAGLRLIDIAISGSHDLRVTLNVLLEQTIKQLHVDAACVLMLNPYSQVLEYALGYGFKGDRISLASVRLGEGFAGRAAMSRHTLAIPEITVVHDGTTPWHLIEDEGFKAYIGVPLVAKGHIKGVLEIFNRSPLRQDKDWLNFAEALAGQAAIALDNAELFERLEHSNNELLLAYDTTIEGWSRALDYRDKETEGHSLRVTDMAVRLCKAVGIGEEELVHVRRGALLHDIGKLGVPDSILLKPGKLTGDEFAVIKKHPDIAFKLLSPIPFLRIALDVPYCHHEKWDGTGYPRGLKGEEIPLSARIFSIIDVWDALRSDRPYRPAWPEDKTREHMRSESGTHFDAKLLDIFLSMDWNEDR
ncbi:MAG TPA: HD domain-containing phosphohydrolase, partial [Nitrospirota bacterium]